MRGIARQEYSSDAELVCDEFGALPGLAGEDLELDVVASECKTHPGSGVESIEIQFGFAANQRQTPQIAAVDDGEVAPGTFRPHENVAFGLAFVVQLGKAGDVKEVSDRVAEETALLRNAEGGPNPARRTIACHHEGRANLEHFVGRQMPDGDRDVCIRLLEMLDAAAVMHFNRGLLADRLGKNRIEPELRAALLLLGTQRSVRQFSLGRVGLMLQQMSGHAGAVDNVELVVVGKAAIPYPVDDTPLAAKLHSAHGYQADFRMVDGAVALIGDRAADTPPPQIQRQGEADGTCSDDQNLRFDTACHMLANLPESNGR